MNFIETIKERARQEIKTIVLPEAEDIRTLKATEVALKEKYANIILVGNEKITSKICNKFKKIATAMLLSFYTLYIIISNSFYNILFIDLTHRISHNNTNNNSHKYHSNRN